MGMNINFSSSANRRLGGNTTTQAYEKAAGFLNLGLPNLNGNISPIGGIPLKEGIPHERELVAMLRQDPEGMLAWLKQACSITFNVVGPKAGSGFALGGGVTPIVSENTATSKFDAYINLELPAGAGTTRRLGFVGLSKAKPMEAGLIAYLSQGEAALAEFREKLSLSFHDQTAQRTGFDFSGYRAAQKPAPQQPAAPTVQPPWMA